MDLPKGIECLATNRYSHLLTRAGAMAVSVLVEQGDGSPDRHLLGANAHVVGHPRDCLM